MRAFALVAALVFPACLPAARLPPSGLPGLDTATRQPPASEVERPVEDAPAVVCEPGKRFCDGEDVWACTRSGTDAILLLTCAEQGMVCRPTSTRLGSTCFAP
jgi:hypothetical protein